MNLDRIKKALPDRAKVTLKKTKQLIPYLDIKINPSLSEKDFEMCKDWQREIIGKENISEFYTEETGHHWKVFLKRTPEDSFEEVVQELIKWRGFNNENKL